MFFTLKWSMSCLWKIMFDQIITTQHDKFHIVPWTPHALLQGSKMGQTCHRQCWSSSKLPSLSSCSHSPSQSSKPTGNSEAASHRYLRLKDNWLQIIDQHDSSSLLARSSCPTRPAWTRTLWTSTLRQKDSLVKNLHEETEEQLLSERCYNIVMLVAHASSNTHT